MSGFRPFQNSLDADAAEIAQGLARKILESCLEHGDPVPPALQSLVGDKPVDLLIPVGVS